MPILKKKCTGEMEQNIRVILITKLLIMEYQSGKLIQIMEENIKPENKCIKE